MKYNVCKISYKYNHYIPVFRAWLNAGGSINDETVTKPPNITNTANETSEAKSRGIFFVCSTNFVNYIKVFYCTQCKVDILIILLKNGNS